MESVDSFCSGSLFCGNLQGIDDVNPFDDQHIAFFFDFSIYVGCQKAVACGYLSRFQRAAECTGQSAPCGCTDVIESGGVGFVDCSIHAVMFCYL